MRGRGPGRPAPAPAELGRCVGGPCRTRLFSGGHFYVNTERDALLDYIKEICLASV
jgi:surfactin synthase thioesterase subunit